MFPFMNRSQLHMSPEEAAAFLKTTPEALAAFEEAYQVHAMGDINPHDPFSVSAKQAAQMAAEGAETKPSEGYDREALDKVCGRIVDELLSRTRIWTFDGRRGQELKALAPAVTPVTKEELDQFPVEVRPQLTGTLGMVDMDASAGAALLNTYAHYLKEKNPKRKQHFYHAFRQGLDILDIDPLLYAMLGMNQNAMGYWLPEMADIAVSQGFFKIPQTTIIVVPLTMLQLARIDYDRVNQTTRNIVNAFCMKAFGLDTGKDYFIKTGTYSSKFDFRNARVTAGKEVTELGEYLLFISNQACLMAGPLTQPSIYGMSTTNEWVAREYIHDAENNPSIYKGLPLHTEYRVFADFDRGTVIGAAPYWDPVLMKNRFGHGMSGGSVHDAHDYVIFRSHEGVLKDRYEKNIDRVKKAVQALAEVVQARGALTGQWSVDVMQNGEDFWLIDMARAQDSALYECVPEALRAPTEENWLPKIPVSEDKKEGN